MTLFIIVLSIFIVSCVISSGKKKAKIREWKECNTSNAKLEYDIACKAIEDMGNAYREIISNKTLDEYLSKISEYSVERRWLEHTAKAMNRTLDNSTFKYIYKNNIWELIPSSLTESSIKEWKNKFQIKKFTSDTRIHLLRAIELKNNILYGNKFGSYREYRNQDIINEVAIKFGMPSREELKILRHLPYQSIWELMYKYSANTINKAGFCSAQLMDIRPNPSEEQKAVQYKALSIYEQDIQNTYKFLEVHDKYYK